MKEPLSTTNFSDVILLGILLILFRLWANHERYCRSSASQRKSGSLSMDELSFESLCLKSMYNWDNLHDKYCKVGQKSSIKYKLDLWKKINRRSHGYE